MRSSLPKVLHRLAGLPLVGHVLSSGRALGVSRTVVVIGPAMDEVAAEVAPATTVVQKERLGTAHALLQARKALEGFTGTVLVLYGDTPLISVPTLEALVRERAAPDNPALVALGFDADDPTGYGRHVVGDNGCLADIIEHRDATPAQRAIRRCNSGVMAFDGAVLFDILDRIGNDNVRGEYYLTDAVRIANAMGRICRAVEGPEEEFLGVNSRVELARAETLFQDRMRRKALEDGATLVAPETVFFSWDTCLGRDVTVHPFVTFGPGVCVEDNATIRSFCHLEGARIAAGAEIGPYARLRPGAEIGPNARVGNFVEIKKSTLEEGAKVNHLSYIGDARVGAGANIGAGTITCNYDGFGKYHTDIGRGTFVGSNSALVAPVRIGDGAMIGAGSTITRDVPGGALALTRASQETLDGWATGFRERRSGNGPRR